MLTKRWVQSFILAETERPTSYQGRDKRRITRFPIVIPPYGRFPFLVVADQPQLLSNQEVPTMWLIRKSRSHTSVISYRLGLRTLDQGGINR